MYSGTWELGTPERLSKTVLNSEVVLFLRSISMYWVDLGTEVAVLNSQVVRGRKDRFYCTHASTNLLAILNFTLFVFLYDRIYTIEANYITVKNAISFKLYSNFPILRHL